MFSWYQIHSLGLKKRASNRARRRFRAWFLQATRGGGRGGAMVSNIPSGPLPGEKIEWPAGSGDRALRASTACRAGEAEGKQGQPGHWQSSPSQGPTGAPEESGEPEELERGTSTSQQEGSPAVGWHTGHSSRSTVRAEKATEGIANPSDSAKAITRLSKVRQFVLIVIQ